MKKQIISVLILGLAFTCAGQCNVNAKGKEFAKQEINYNIGDDETSFMNVNAKGKVQFTQYNTDPEKDKNDSFYLKLTKKQVKGKSIETIKNKKIESDIMDSFTYVKTLDKCTITVYNDGKYACISEYDNGGKKTFSFKDKVYTTKRCYYFMCDIWDDNDNIYYVYWSEYFDSGKRSGATLRCINKKTKKVKTINSFASKNKYYLDSKVYINDGYVYELTEKKLYAYSIKDRKTKTYTLPEGKKSLYEEGVDSEEYKYLKHHNFTVCGSYIYYCNKNGIYRCNTKKEKVFHKYYDGTKDEYFGHEYGAAEICVKDNNTFYVKFEDSNVYKTCGDKEGIKLVKYSR